MISELAGLFFAIGCLLMFCTAFLNTLAEAITKCQKQIKEAEAETRKVKSELEEKNKQLQFEYENKIALLKQGYDNKLSDMLKSVQTAEQNKNAKSAYAELCEKEMKAIESVQTIYANYLSEPIKRYLKGISKGRLLNAFKNDFTFRLTKFDLEAQLISGANTYKTTLFDCSCDDFRFSHGAACKHMLFLAYSLGLLQVYPRALQNEFDKMAFQAKTSNKSTKKTTGKIRGSEDSM